MTLARLAADTANTCQHIPHRTARTCTYLATLLAQRLPTAQTNITLELGTLDGWPTSTPGAPDRGTRPRGAVSRPTETIALNRIGARNDGPETDRADLYELVTVAHEQAQLAATGDDPDTRLTGTLTALRACHRICDRHMGRSDHDPDAHRCQGTGDATGATCTQLYDYRIGDGSIILPAADRRCIDCHHAVEQRQADEAARAEDARETKAAALRSRDAERKRKQQRSARWA